MSFERSVILAHTQPIRPVTGVRSTLLQSSLTYLRERGHFEQYVALLDPVHRTTIVDSIAPCWMPVAVALAHYAACDALSLPASEQVAIGEAVGNRLQGTMISSFMKKAREVGMTPLVLLSRFDRLYNRLLQGGSVQVVRSGPKDAELELCGAVLPQSHYFRVALTGMLRASLKFFGTTSFVKQRSYNAQRDQFVISMAWV